jgi:predicted ATP-grasp superfamily ATP-dependent carboligase
MKILAFEYASSGGPGGEPFIEEGRLMLAALLCDLAGDGSWRVTTLLKSTADKSGVIADEAAITDGEFFSFVEREMKNVDAVWVVAPESGGALLRLTTMAQRLGKKVVGSLPDAVELCGDKLSLSRYLEKKLPMPWSEPFSGGFDGFPCVVKPVDGAGSENVHFIKEAGTLRDIEANEQNYLVQPYIKGKKLSGGVFTHRGEPILLGVCRQKVYCYGGSLKQTGITGPIEYRHADRLLEMVKKINRLIPGLRGYWGVDFIDDDGSLTLIEINPRLTTSYPVYSGTCGFNMASLAVDEAMGRPAIETRTLKAALR